ncbi:MAG TPA: hypothetical protein VG099_13490 [Gemmataceae bacterium]|jgi:hypothetical protein|nr:hypothetical protein [Gemmataceae bacterium]
MESFKILLLCVAAAIIYGILHDQVTAHLCVEYFTIGHPPIFPTTNPTLLAFGWGVAATWWVGVLLGVPLLLAARAGHRPKLLARDLVKRVAFLMTCAGILAAGAGVGGFFAASNGELVLLGPLARLVPADKHILFLTDACAHTISYAAGFILGIELCVSTWKRRGSLKRSGE